MLPVSVDSSSDLDEKPRRDESCLAEIVAECCNTLQKRRKRIGVWQLRRSWFLNAVIVINVYGFWTAACVCLSSTTSALLWSALDWFQAAQVMYQGHALANPGSDGLWDYSGCLLKAWTLSCLAGEFIRFCYWLARDAARPDSFEAYRRLLTGDLSEIRNGALYLTAPTVPSRGTRRLNISVHCLIYATLDVYPLLCVARTIIDGSVWEMSLGSIVCLALWALTVAASFHVCVFFSAWTLADIYLKAEALRTALRSSRSNSAHELDNAELQEPQSLTEIAANGESDDDDEASTKLELRMQNHVDSDRRWRRPSTRAVIESMNICVQLCGWVFAYMPLLAWIATIFLGALLRQRTVVATALVLVVLHACYLSKDFCFRRCRRLRSLSSLGSQPRLWALQRWGERTCGLSKRAQLEARRAFSIFIIIQAFVFAFFGWWTYVAFCACCLFANVARQLSASAERPWGWLLGFLEGLFNAAFIVVLQRKQFWLKDYSRSSQLQVLSMICLRQFGLARFRPDGWRIVHLTQIVLNGLFAGVLVVVLGSIVIGGNYTKNFSMFCDESLPNCTYYSVPYSPPWRSKSAACSIRYPTDGAGNALSLVDFGLLSSLTYESREKIDAGFRHYFPGWTLINHHYLSTENEDWTTFFEVVNPTNTTLVFAVKGTQTMTDALYDIAMWASSAVNQILSELGPSIGDPTLRVLTSMSGAVQRQSDLEYNISFRLSQRVEEALMSRRYEHVYITGHSLGGGIAALVAAASMGAQAVTFMAPGVENVGLRLHGIMEGWRRRLLRNTLNVMPEHDIVSRVDKQIGLQVPIPCDGNPAYCHDVFVGLCTLYSMCGSLRPSETLRVPCGKCKERQCPGF
eukprot:TRINITY_DN27489_c0_g1_i1.p1 TRINITY_DN27489_c0_g1~~TRINITY_DN27489_c0_g1_i1.p1  ORF type:complete len:859 (+),score=161.41 TRINITY_DN27489_c0_g1_i1:95-2671(+)